VYVDKDIPSDDEHEDEDEHQDKDEDQDDDQEHEEAKGQDQDDNEDPPSVHQEEHPPADAQNPPANAQNPPAQNPPADAQNHGHVDRLLCKKTTNGSLERISQVSTCYGPDGALIVSHLVHKGQQPTDANKVEYNRFHKKLTGFTSQVLQAIKENTDYKYPGHHAFMLCTLNTVTSDFCMHHKRRRLPYSCLSMRPAFCQSLLLSNRDNEELVVADFISTTLQDFINFHWQNWPR
jgi:hypothetical protein